MGRGSERATEPDNVTDGLTANHPKPLPMTAKENVLTVAQVSSMVKSVLADALPPKLRVIGEVSNLSNRTHWFFSLKDDQATISCVCFASAARRVSFPVQDGLEVIATGRIDYYDAQGRLQLYVDKLEPVGQGPLELRFRALCEQLRGLGYFDIQRKKPLPMVPRRVAMVTSRQAAALQDVINTASQRWPGCELLLVDVRVQGEDAAGEIAAALAALSNDGQRLGIDAILLTRGGGSIEDLWAFNERQVADALYECALPVVAAIGHETDTTVAELVADLRCATPTQAAMTLIPDRAALAQQIDQLSQRLTLLLSRQHQQASHQLRALERHPIFRKPDRLLDWPRQRLDTLADRLGRLLPQRFDSCRDRLKALRRQLEAVGPKNVLTRGYTYTRLEHGPLVRSVRDTHDGDVLVTVLSDGSIRSRVTGSSSSRPDANQVTKARSTSPVIQVPSKKKTAKSNPPSKDDQPRLF